MPSAPGLAFPRYFTVAGFDPFNEIEWDVRAVVIRDETGKVVFEQRELEIPRFWSQQATDIVSTYFRQRADAPGRERSVRQLIARVVDTIKLWAHSRRYFTSDEALESFADELKHLLVYQKAAFSSQIWLNCGIEGAPLCASCFINAVQGTTDSILDLVRTEGLLLAPGSGTGSNVSMIRSSRERKAIGSNGSGPVSFLRGYEAFASAVDSGGAGRAGARTVILNADHPDIVDFINCKAEEKKKARALIEAGYDGARAGTFSTLESFQDCSISVRATDDFMRAVLDQGRWQTWAVNRDLVDTYEARDLLKGIAEASWVCGDPGMQFDTTVNEWHTCPNSGRINASNPTSEYMFLDDSACSLASIDLMKFVRKDGELDVAGFKAACQTLITAQEIIVSNSSYSTETIEKNSHHYRPLGLGYANLGRLLMSRGVPYDSDRGRAYAAAITAVMTGEAYAQSARIARDHGWPFAGYEQNREPFLRVMRRHRAAVSEIDPKLVPPDLFAAVKQAWNEAVELGEEFGYRNAQATILGATETVGLLMDADTTGVEPEVALVKSRKIPGGGPLKIVNSAVPIALKKLGYTQAAIEAIVRFVDEHETIEGAPFLEEEHLAVFDCAVKAREGERSIHYMGHIKMIGAVQPFISGAISKTVTMPREATVEDIESAYIESWRLGAKAISICRDSRESTPHIAKATAGARRMAAAAADESEAVSEPGNAGAAPTRPALPDQHDTLPEGGGVIGGGPATITAAVVASPVHDDAGVIARLTESLGSREWLLAHRVTNTIELEVAFPAHWTEADLTRRLMDPSPVTVDVTGILPDGTQPVFVALHASGAVAGIRAYMDSFDGRLLLTIPEPLQLLDSFVDDMCERTHQFHVQLIGIAPLP